MTLQLLNNEHENNSEVKKNTGEQENTGVKGNTGEQENSGVKENTGEQENSGVKENTGEQVLEQISEQRKRKYEKTSHTCGGKNKCKNIKRGSYRKTTPNRTKTTNNGNVSDEERKGYLEGYDRRESCRKSYNRTIYELLACSEKLLNKAQDEIESDSYSSEHSKKSTNSRGSNVSMSSSEEITDSDIHTDSEKQEESEYWQGTRNHRF
jgi:hypothetical protein